MSTMNVNELAGAELDCSVARAEGFDAEVIRSEGVEYCRVHVESVGYQLYQPTQNRNIAMAIQLERLYTVYPLGTAQRFWFAEAQMNPDFHGLYRDESALIAICRLRVAEAVALGVKAGAVPVDDVDAVLMDWYTWSQEFRPVAGYVGADSTCRDFKISNQWMDYEDLSEVVDYQLLSATGEAVEPIILTLNIQHRVAVMTAVRNFVAGALVFTNPRSPATQDADYAAAKAVMRPMLFAKGLIKRL